MFKAGLVPERLALMDRTARQWGSPRRRAKTCPTSWPRWPRSTASRFPATCQRADMLVTAAPAELGEHTRALADGGEDPATAPA